MAASRFLASGARPGLGGPWYGEVVGYTVAGDGSDSECLGESRVEAWGWQRSAVEPTHFEARSELELLVATWRNSNADGELSSVFRVTFALPIAHRFDFSGGSDGVILLAQIGGDKILQLGNAQRPETGWLEPGSYMLESTIRAHNGERQFAFQFDLTPAPVPETGSTVTALLLGLALLSAGKRRIRPSATRR